MAEISEEQRLRNKFDEVESRFFTGYLNQVDVNREYYNLKYGPRLLRDNNIEALVPPTAARAIDEPADHILFHPRIRVPIRPTDSDQQREEDIAERKRKFVNSWWNQVTLRFNPIGDGRKSFLNEGKIGIRKTLRWDMIPDKPENPTQKQKDAYRREIRNLGRKEWLWDVELLDNQTIFEDPSSHRDPKYVYIKYRILIEEARDRWPEKAHLWRGMNEFDELDYVEYWSKPTRKDGDVKPGRYAQWVERDNVHMDDSPYPYIPVVIEDAGFGMTHSLAKPIDKYVGMTQHAFPIFEAEAIQMTSIQEVTKITAFPIVKARNMADDKDIEVGANQIINLEGDIGTPGAEDFEIVSWPPIPQSVEAMLSKTDRLANSTFKMNILGGIPQTGVETATEADQNVRNATSKLASPIAALERLVMRLTSQVLIDIEEVLEAPVTVFGTGAKDQGEITLNPTDIAAYYHVSAELSTSDEEAISQNKARFWMEAALRHPFLSFMTAMEKGEISDSPQQEMMKRAAEDVFLSEQFKQIRIATGAQAFGELATLMQQQMAEQGGQTGEGTTETSPLGLPGATGENFETALANRDVTQGASQLQA